jgi:hypothetical protein
MMGHGNWATSTTDAPKVLAIWRTQRGLAPGDAVREMRSLHPRARKRSGRWWLVTGRRAGAPAPRLSAEVQGGAVRALWVDVG